MVKVNFSFDEEIDIFNFWESCNIPNLWEGNKKQLKQKFIDRWKGKNYKESRPEISSHLKMLYDSGFIEIFQNLLEKGWNKINEEYFQRLNTLTQKPIYTEEFKGLITTSGRCYADKDNDFFLVSIRRPYLHALRTCGHELLHLQVNHYYWVEMQEELGIKRATKLSEGLTTLLNPHFRDLWMAEDMGYREHKELRNYLESEWMKDKNFVKLIRKGINYIKDEL